MPVHGDDGFRSKVLVIGGPTASGKSALALMLAERLGGMVINADSLQLYDALPILTSFPDAAALARVPHRLYGMLRPDETSTAARWTGQARAAIDEALANGQAPIVVGGTGLYLEALTRGLAPIPAIPPAMRPAAEHARAALGNEAFHARLVAADPLAAHLKPGDTQRLVRAWEVWSATGRSLFSWQRDPLSPPPYDFTCFALLPERAALYDACDRRFGEMIRHGALEEVARFLGSWPESVAAARALGLRELAAHLRGEIDLPRAIDLAQAATRHYAKRQVTWFRNRFAGAHVLANPADENVEKFLEGFRGN